MDIRYAKEEDKGNVIDLWKYCFNDSEEFISYYFSKKYKEENTIVLEEDDEIITALQLNQYNIKLNNKSYDVSYVVGVSTLPEARGRGYMKNIMDFSLEEMYNRGQELSILMPIDFRLYRKYGYENCYDQIEYNLNIDELSKYKIYGKFEKCNSNNINELIKIYNEFTENLNGCVNRDISYYNTLTQEVKSENGNIYLYKKEEYEGYIIYFINGDTMFVRELYSKNIESTKAMLKFIYNHNTQCKKVIITTPYNDKIRYILDNPKTCDMKIKPFMMGRIINLKKYLENMKLDNINLESIKIYVEDNQIEVNNGVFEIEIKNGIVGIEKIQGEYDFNIDINSLSQLAFSYIDFDEFLEIKGYKLDAIDENITNIFKKIFNKKINYINEYV